LKDSFFFITNIIYQELERSTEDQIFISTLRMPGCVLQNWKCGRCEAEVFCARLDCFKCGAPKFGIHLCDSEFPQELFDSLEKHIQENFKDFGLVKIIKPFTSIHVLRLPEEVDVEEELLYSQKKYEGEEWAPITHHIVSELWDEYEMSDDMDIFEKECETKENLINLQALSPLPSGEYYVPDEYYLETAGDVIEEIKYKELNHKDAQIPYEGPTWEDVVMERVETRFKDGYPWFSDVIYYSGGRTPVLPPGVWNTPLLDDQDRVCTIVAIKKKGNNFCIAESPYGDVYIDIKFISYVPDVGEHAVMVIKKKSLGKNAPFVCKRIHILDF
jgi:hypothetical protein